MLTNCIGAPDEANEEKDLRIAELEDIVEKLEQDNFKVKQEMSQSKGFDVPRNKDESDKIIKDLSKQNALLRRKLDDAVQKITK